MSVAKQCLYGNYTSQPNIIRSSCKVPDIFVPF